MTYYLKTVGIACLVLAWVAGCATTEQAPMKAAEPAPKPMAAPAVEPAKPAGPSAADANKAIWAAERAASDAKKQCGAWRDTGKLLDAARKAAKAGDNAKAIKSANVVTEQSNDCINQAQEEHAKFVISELAAYQGMMNGDQQARYRSAQQALANHQGKQAGELAGGLQNELLARIVSYRVASGDSLSVIAARMDVYGDPAKWQMIYDANRAQISDPNRLMPGQVLKIIK